VSAGAGLFEGARAACPLIDVWQRMSWMVGRQVPGGVCSFSLYHAASMSHDVLLGLVRHV
jgi:hypothetical protein